LVGLEDCLASGVSDIQELGGSIDGKAFLYNHLYEAFSGLNEENFTSKETIL